MNQTGMKGLISQVITPESPTYNLLKAIYRSPKALYRRMTKSSIFFAEGELYMASLPLPKKLDLMLELFRPKTVLDLGCGTGWSLSYLIDHGIDAMGVEGSPLAISKSRHAEKIVRHDLNKELNLGRRYDVLWSVEVVEHIHPDYVGTLLKSFSNHADRIVMSAATPGQGGEGHFNEQPPEYWIEKFEKAGYMLDAASTEKFRAIEEWHSENMLVFSR